MPGASEAQSAQLSSHSTALQLQELKQLVGDLSAGDRDVQDGSASMAGADYCASLIERLSLGDKADGQLCSWLSSAYTGSDPGLRLLVLAVLPTLCKTYLLRLANSFTDSLEGFEAVLITVYNSLLNQSPRPAATSNPSPSGPNVSSTQASRPRSLRTEQFLALDPTQSIPGLRRTAVVGTVLGTVVSNLSQLPADTRSELCMLTETVALHGCPWASDGLNLPAPIPEQYKATARHVPDEEDIGLALTTGKSVVESEGITGHYTVGRGPQGAIAEPALKDSDGASTSASAASRQADTKPESDGRSFSRILLPNELLQPLVQGLAYCLLDVRPQAEESHQLAVSASQSLFARVLHDAKPEQILATQTLLRLHAIRA